MKKHFSSEDISPILRGWEYHEESTEKNIRRLRLPNGREVLQVRLPLGVEQYEIHGRPDGARPEGFESWLDHYRHQAEVYGREFVLDDESCDRLHGEGILYYHRYLRFFQIQEYQLCMRDTSRNLRLLEFVRRYAGKPEHIEMLDQYRPYILRMQIMSRALLLLKEKEDYRGALRVLRQGLEEIRSLPDIPENNIFEWERTRSVHSLEDLVTQIEQQAEVHSPPSPREKVAQELDEAVAAENYERAAVLRDMLRRMEGDDQAV